jgi:hypothetical protein
MNAARRRAFISGHFHAGLPLFLAHKMGNHQMLVRAPKAKPEMLSVQVQAKTAKKTDDQPQYLLSTPDARGSKAAHHNPNRMCEMKREADLPPKGGPSHRSKHTMHAVAKPALNTAHFSTRSTDDLDKNEPSLTANRAIPATASGNFTRTSFNANMGSLHADEKPERATKDKSASPANPTRLSLNPDDAEVGP